MFTCDFIPNVILFYFVPGLDTNWTFDIKNTQGLLSNEVKIYDGGLKGFKVNIMHRNSI